MEQLFNDLVWLSKRTKGLQELIDYTSDFSSLKNQVQEMTNSKNTLSKEIENLRKDKDTLVEDLNDTSKELEVFLSQVDVKAESIISKANEDAKSILEEANAKSTCILVDTKDRVLNIESTIKERQDYLSSIKDSISSSEKKLADLNQAIEVLKGKF